MTSRSTHRKVWRAIQAHWASRLVVVVAAATVAVAVAVACTAAAVVYVVAAATAARVDGGGLIGFA